MSRRSAPATTRQPGKTGHYKSRLYVGKEWYPSRAHTKRDDGLRAGQLPMCRCKDFTGAARPANRSHSPSTVEPRLVVVYRSGRGWADTRPPQLIRPAPLPTVRVGYYSLPPQVNIGPAAGFPESTGVFYSASAMLSSPHNIEG